MGLSLPGEAQLPGGTPTPLPEPAGQTHLTGDDLVVGAGRFGDGTGGSPATSHIRAYRPAARLSAARQACVRVAASTKPYGEAVADPPAAEPGRHHRGERRQPGRLMDTTGV